MGKASSAEQDETRLQKKVQAKLAENTNPKGDQALRALRKRLKRTQRKRRTLAARVLQAKGAGGEKSGNA